VLGVSVSVSVNVSVLVLTLVLISVFSAGVCGSEREEGAIFL